MNPAIEDPSTSREVVQVVPLGDETYAYRLPVPRGWSYGGSVGRALDLETIARPIGVFAPPERRAISLSVGVTALPMEVRLEEWLATELAGARWRVDEMQWHRIAGLDRLAVVASRDRVMRALAAVADGGRLYTVDIVGPTAQKAEIGQHLWWSAMAFALSRPGAPGRLEARASRHVGGHRFEAPTSWVPAATQDPTRVDLVLRHDDGSSRARLGVRLDAAAVSTIDERRAQTLQRYAARGWVPSRTLETPTVPWRGLPPGWELRATQARLPSGAVVDLLLAHGAVGGTPIEVVALGSRDATRTWMRASRALEIVCESIEA